jgi:hypothetical protein
MPGLFPGMDPYLEASNQWPGFHAALIYCCFAALNRELPPMYRARIECPPPGSETRQRYIDVVVVGAPGRVVTTVEVLSPANKRPGAGREEYLRKQAATLDSDTHLLEIDLLRDGEYAVAAPASGILREHGPWHYAVSLHRAGQGDLFEAWARTVRQRLPRELRVPLDDGRPDVLLDLQAALDRAYDEGRFAEGIDYATDPVPPLPPEDAAWADALLKEKGLRS